MTRIALLICILAGAAFALACSSDSTGTPTGSPTTEPTAATPIAREVLSDGSAAYAHQPQLAYIDPDKRVWLFNVQTRERIKLMDGCTGMQSAKRGEVIVSGLFWSDDASRLACWNDDLSVRTSSADGKSQSLGFRAGECELGPRWAPGGEFIACSHGNSIVVRTWDGRDAATIAGVLQLHWGWSPSGTRLIAPGLPSGDHGTWTIYDPSGGKLATIGDAFVAEGSGFAWTRDGARIAFPSKRGISVIDLSQGASRQDYVAGPDSQLGTGPQVWWLADGHRILFANYAGVGILDTADGSVSTLNRQDYSFARLAPDGAHLASAVETGNSVFQIRVNMLGAAPDAVSDGLVDESGIGFGLQFRFSGDSSRLCWQPRPQSPAYWCADLADKRGSRVEAPIQMEPDVLGFGDEKTLWTMFSPDLRLVAFVEPGDPSPAPNRTLSVARTDGSNRVSLGPTLGFQTFSWRPDGVYNPWLRIR